MQVDNVLNRPGKVGSKSFDRCRLFRKKLSTFIPKGLAKIGKVELFYSNSGFYSLTSFKNSLFDLVPSNGTEII